MSVGVDNVGRASIVAVPARQRTVRNWTSAEVRVLREARRMGVREFSEHLGVSDRIVSKWEAAGRHIRPRPVNQAALDTSLAMASADVRARFVDVTGWFYVAKSTVLPVAPGQQRWIVHLVVDLPDGHAVLNLAEQLVMSPGRPPAIQAGETTISRADHESSRHRVFCNRVRTDNSRCPLRFGHHDGCGMHDETLTRPSG